MDPSLTVGPAYVHRLAGWCQCFVGAVCVAEPDGFRSAVHELTAHLPAFETSANLLFTWALLGSVVIRGALTQHAQFHRCFGGACEFQPAAAPPLDTSEWSVMRQRINDWAETHANAFDRAHRWPAAAKAAAALRRQPQRTSYTADLARSVGASCSTLERGFTAIYGTTPGQYHTMVRLRHTVEAMRRDSGSLEGVAVEAGWASVNAFGRALRTVTGVKPSMLRRLPDEEYAALVQVQLTLPVPKPV